MSIGADWRQNSPGSVAGLSTGVANNKFANSGPGEQLVDGAQDERDFSEYMFGDDGFEFTDVLDVLNPLQHIPGVGMLYRSMTGDELGNGARVVGGGLFGGVFGLAGAAIDAVVDAVTGEDTGTHVMAFLGDSFNGAPVDDGTAIADASASGGSDTLAANAAGFAGAGHLGGAQTVEMAQAVSDGSYQGDLVLPWMAGQAAEGRASGMAVPAAEQATIVQAAPVGAVHHAELDAPVNAAGAQTVASTIKASDLNTPWTLGGNLGGNGGGTATGAPAHAQGQTATSPKAEMAAATMQNDPAELAVAMASAGGNSPVSTLNRSTLAQSAQNGADPIRRASFSNEGGDTVWARAASSGRVSRSVNTFAISPEMSEYAARKSKLTAAQPDDGQTAGSDRSSTDQNPAKANRITPASASADFRNGETPLSAAEMAAKFNAALGREQAQTMAAEAVSSSNAVADQGKIPGSFNNRNTRSDGDRTQPQTEAAPVTHPLMEEVTSHAGGDAPVGAWFSQTMMDGLKKYQEMQQNRQNPANAI